MTVLGALTLVFSAALWSATVTTSAPAGAAPPSTTPTGTLVDLEEFVNDGAFGHLWNEYDQTQYGGGPQIFGRAAPVAFGATELQVFTLGAGDHLFDWVNDGLWGRTWNAYDLSASAGGGGSIVGSPAAVVIGNLVYVFVEASGGDLVEYVNNDKGGNLWNVTDLSTTAGNGAAVDGDPAIVDQGGTLRVFVKASSGDLTEYADDGKSGNTWNAYDLSTMAAGGTQVTGDPSTILFGGTTIHAYVRSAAGDLLEYVNDASHGGWDAYDLTSAAANGVQITGDPTSVVYGTVVHVYVRSATGDLIELANNGTGGTLWNAYDLTQSASGGVQVVGNPDAVLYGTIVHVYTRSTDNHLIEFIGDGSQNSWNAYDLTLDAGGGTTIGSNPVAIVYRSTSVHVYIGGPSSGLADSIVSLAESQDQNYGAVVEDPPDSNCNGYTAYFGRGTTAGCAPGTASEEWCSDFADWVWTLNGIDTSGITGYAYTWVGYGEAHGTFLPGPTNDPRPGDAIVWGSTAQGYSPHMGIVVGVKDGDIDMVSGNSGPVDASGNVVAVWDSGYFDPTTTTIDGYPVLGYVVP